MIFYLEKRDSNPHVTNYGQWFIIINIMLISVNENYKTEGICLQPVVCEQGQQNVQVFRAWNLKGRDIQF